VGGELGQPLQRSRRIWLVDRQAHAIGQELRDDLGDWRRCLSVGVKSQGDKAQEILKTCVANLKELREQWDLQRESQLLLRARKPSY
jgi:hypothetical protein